MRKKSTVFYKQGLLTVGSTYFSGENNQRNLKKKVFEDVYFASFQDKISIFCLPVQHPYLYNMYIRIRNPGCNHTHIEKKKIYIKK
jgi:hypothetical protein